MLNGKFYTGLTENQLNRSAGPNRQKTNFFWPDDRERPANNATSNRSRNNDVARKYNESGELVRNPKELFKKQLSSKIQFYDTTDSSKTPPSVRKQNQRRELNRNVYEKNFHNNSNDNSPLKPKTFESKIEFYDFVDTNKPKEPTTKFNATKMMVHEKKKISFDDAADEWDKTKKGILKNRDDRMSVEHNVPIDISEHRTSNRNNGTKLQLSKSMDNVAKGKFAINDDYNDRNEKVNEMTNQLNKLNINNNNSNKEKNNLSRRSDVRHEFDMDYHPKGVNEHSKYNSPPTRRNERHLQRNSYHGSHGLNNDNFEIMEERYSTTKNYDNKGYARRNSDQYDHNERSNLRKQLHTKNNTFNDRLQANAIDETDEFHEETPTKTMVTPQDSSRYRNESHNEPRKERIISIKRSSTINGGNDYPNEARRRAHTHLQSNIFFRDDVRLQQQRPLSIRESAVTRVGVGLPDI